MSTAGERLLSSPITGIAGCCARAASGGRGAEKRDELASFHLRAHSITSSARASSFAETFGVCVRPSRMKVFVANTWTAQSSGDE